MALPHRRLVVRKLVLGGLLVVSTMLVAVSSPAAEPASAAGGVSPAPAVAAPDLAEIDTSASELRSAIERYVADRSILNRSYPVEISPARRARFQQFYTDWLALLAKLPFDTMSQDGKVDYVLLRSHIEHQLAALELENKQLAEEAPLIPFASTITGLAESRRRMESVDSARLAVVLNDLQKQIESTRRSVEASLRGGRDSVKKTVASRAAATVGSLRNTLRGWYQYYNGYDPMFTWWVGEPYRSVDGALGSYASFLNERIVGLRGSRGGAAGGDGDGEPPTGGRGGRTGGAGPAGEGGGRGAGGGVARAGDTSDIIGDPIGRDGLMVELASEMIPYTPEELIAIAHQEFAWCENEMKKAAREMGLGDDWLAALEKVKSIYVEPGKQTDLIRDLAIEAIEYVEKNNLVTVPPLARESWRMQMMSPERQLVSPFFLGGEVIQVSYPTNTMAHEQKLMSMRGNNVHFARATVFHELIPGHHLQGYMNARYKSYRSLFATPFWTEGWALYWELRMWDLNFARGPEDKIGMLFWRMHRCARIIFSLSFHLEKMSPQECIDLLVKRVGHEPDNAAAEVRRSFNGSYEPLYQAGYLLGGMQIYALQKELVGGGKMTDRAFHDAVLKENRMPIEMVRATLTKQPLTRDFKTSWKFYGPSPTAPASPTP